MKTTNRKWQRSPRELVGTLADTDLPPPPREVSLEEEEQLLLSALRAREEAAFELILDRWYSPMLRVALGYVRSKAEAEEVVQETWLAVLRGLDAFEGRSSLKTWVFRILANRARTHARRRARTVPLTDVTSPTVAAQGIGPDQSEWLFRPERTGPLGWHGSSFGIADPFEELATRDLRARIEAAIQELPARQQEVMTLRDLEGWSAEEVCNALELSEVNQRVLLHRARMKVRDAIFAGE